MSKAQREFDFSVHHPFKFSKLDRRCYERMVFWILKPIT